MKLIMENWKRFLNESSEPAGNETYVLQLVAAWDSPYEEDKTLGKFPSREEAEKALEKHLLYNTEEEDYDSDEEYEEVLNDKREEDYRIFTSSEPSAPPSPAGNKPYVLQLVAAWDSPYEEDKTLGTFSSRQEAEKALEKHLLYNTEPEDYDSDEEYEEVLNDKREEDYRIFTT